jgi:glycosyltransferase involved in cell wall biosynthesis
LGNERLNLVYVAEFVTGGSVESLHSLVAGLDKSRFEPTVLFYREPSSDIRQRFEDAGATVLILLPGVSSSGLSAAPRRYDLQTKVRRMFGRHIERLYASLKYIYTFLRHKRVAYRELRRRFAAISPDLVHLNNGLATDIPGILAAARCGLPVVCHVRAFSHHNPVQIWASRFVSQFLCVSGAIREHVIAAGVDPARTVVCYDSVNQERFKSTHVDRAALRSEFGWDASAKVFGIIGRLDLWKGHTYFIEAINIARATNPAVCGLVVGDTTPSDRTRPYIESLFNLVRKYGLEDCVRFAGHRTDVPEIIESLDAVICASSSPEPFGLMVVESMAVRTPVIATNAGGPAEMITDNQDGLLVPIRDSKAMAHAILRIAGDDDFAQSLGAAGQETVNSRFTVAHHVNNVCNAYQFALADAEQE